MHWGFSFPALMDYFQKRLFRKIMVWKGQITVTIATYKTDGYPTATTGDSRQGGLKMYFRSYWYERLGLLSWKTNWHQLKDNAEMSLGRVHTWQLLQGLILVFILSFLPPTPLCLCFYYGDITPRVQAKLHNKWLFWDSMLRSHCQLSPVAWDGFLLNIPPLHWGMGGMGW